MDEIIRLLPTLNERELSSLVRKVYQARRGRVLMDQECPDEMWCPGCGRVIISVDAPTCVGCEEHFGHHNDREY